MKSKDRKKKLAGEMADIMAQAARRQFHLVTSDEMRGLRVEDIRQLHLSRLREQQTVSKPPKATSDPIDLLDPYPKLRGKAAMTKLRELDASLFPKFKSEDAATRYEDNLWRRIKYERKRRRR